MRKAIDRIFEAKSEYQRGRTKKWFCTGFLATIGLFVGFTTPYTSQMLDKAVFSRAGIDGLFKTYIGDTPILKALTKEVLFVSYDFNHNQPRFYSKELARKDMNIFDVTISQASASSAAIPGGFPPKNVMTGYNITDVNIDGGIIANNPALYAYIMSQYNEKLYKEKANIRVLALSCGRKTYGKKGTLKDEDDA